MTHQDQLSFLLVHISPRHQLVSNQKVGRFEKGQNADSFGWWNDPACLISRHFLGIFLAFSLHIIPIEICRFPFPGPKSARRGAAHGLAAAARWHLRSHQSAGGAHGRLSLPVPWPIGKFDTATLWLCQNSYWKWPFIVSFPIKNGDFP